MTIYQAASPNPTDQATQISYLLSSHYLYRVITMFRGATVSLIYNHTLSLQDGDYDVSAAVTLMSNDVDQITFCLEELHECWSRLLEVIIGLPLLTRQLGWIASMPLVVVLGKPQRNQ